jgi:hypothetical protein
MSDDFNWNDTDDIVVAFQERIAVYTNGDGDVVLRQDGHGYCRDDAWIVVRPENVRQLVEAMLALVGPPEQPLALPAPTDKTAAERQRRHRERKRHGDDTVTTVTVTPCARNGANLFPD